MKNIILIIFILLLTNTVLAQTFDVGPEWQFGVSSNNLGAATMKVIDLDNDSSNELLLSSSATGTSDGGDDFLYILKYSEFDSTYQSHWISRTFDSYIVSTILKDYNNDLFQDIVVGLRNGDFHVFDGKSLKEINSFSTKKKLVSDIAIADIDNDSQDEIIIGRHDSIFIFSLCFKLELSIPIAGFRIDVGNIDDDAALEIVSSSGIVIEIHNDDYIVEREFESHPYTFTFELSNTDLDNELELLFQTHSLELSCYDFTSNSENWRIDVPSQPYSMNIFNNSNEATNEVYLGTDNHGINVYDAADGSFRRKTSDHHSGINNVAIGDVDNDQEIELIWANSAYSSANDILFVHRFDDLSEEWRSSYLAGTFTTLDYGDLDNDGENEFVVVSASSGQDGGSIFIFNARDKSLEWKSDPFSQLISSVKIADANNDGINELLVGTQGTTNSILYEYETNKYELKFAKYFYSTNRIRDIEVADINNDLANEIILSSGSGYGGDSSLILVLAGESKELLWQSDALGGVANHGYSLSISDIDNDETLEIVGINYNFFSHEPSGKIFIIDGEDYSIQLESQFSYSCLTTKDYNSDGQIDIIAGTDSGDIVVLNGIDLEKMFEFNVDSNRITAIEMIEDEDNPSIVYCNGIKLKQITRDASENLYTSDVINSQVGNYNSLIVSRINDDSLEVLVGSKHSIYLFDLRSTEIFVNDYPWDCEASTSIDNIKQEDKSILVFPNPFIENVTIAINSDIKVDTEIQLYDIFGQLVYRKTHSSIIGQNRHLLSLNHLISGVYVYRVMQRGNIIQTGKMVTKIK